MSQKFYAWIVQISIVKLTVQSKIMHGIIRVRLIHFTTLKIICFGNMEFAYH